MIPLSDDGVPLLNVDESKTYDGTERFMPPSAGEGPMVRFYARSQHQGRASLDEGRPVHKPILFVEIRHPGERDTIDRQAQRDDCYRWPREYNAFKESRSTEMFQGTPLDVLFPHHPDTVEMLRFHRVYSVEQLAKLSDTAKSNVGMGAHEWATRAQKYLTATEKGKGFAFLDKENSDLKAKLARAEANTAQLGAKLEQMTGQMQQLMTQQQQMISMGAVGAIVQQGGGFQMPQMQPMAPIINTISPDENIQVAEPRRGPGRPPAGQSLDTHLAGVEPNFDLLPTA